MYTFESISNLGFYNEDFKMREGHELHKRFLQRYKIYNLRILIKILLKMSYQRMLKFQ